MVLDVPKLAIGVQVNQSCMSFVSYTGNTLQTE